MGKLKINHSRITPESAATLTSLCPFGAISYQEDTLTISSACKMCKLCVKNGGGLIEFEEERKDIDKSLWKGICVYADCTEGTLHRVTLELCGKAKELASVTGHPVTAWTACSCMTTPLSKTSALSRILPHFAILSTNTNPLPC